MKGEWEPFFKENGEYRISVHFYESDNRFTVEQLYQAIKERLKDELVSDTRPERITAILDRAKK